MNDLRHDPYQETHAVTDDYGHRLYTVTTVQDCPDVPMPDLRSAAARDLDAAARELPPLTYAQRTDAKMDALWMALQALTARVDVLEQAGEVPFAMAEDAWGVG